MIFMLLVSSVMLSGAIVRGVYLDSPGGRAMAFRTESRLGAIGVAELQRDPSAVIDDPLRAVRSSKLAEIPATEIHDAWLEHFDPQAAILLTAGADGAPGRLGIDDDFDGVIDNPSELGAVGSDDHVVTPIDPDFEQQLDRSYSRIVGRGTFIPGKPEPLVPGKPEPLVPGKPELGDAIAKPLRLLIHGNTRGRDWVWTVEVGTR